MPAIRIVFEKDLDSVRGTILANKEQYHTLEDLIVTPLDNGMQSGKTSLMLALPFKRKVGMANTKAVVLLETSLKAFLDTAVLLSAKYKEEVEAEGIGYFGTTPEAKAMLHELYYQIIANAIPNATHPQIENCIAQMFNFQEAGMPQEAKDALQLKLMEDQIESEE